MDSPCNYKLKALFLEHNVDWLNPAPAKTLLAGGFGILIGGSPSGEGPQGIIITDEARSHMDEYHTPDSEYAEGKSVWTVAGAERDRAIRIVMEQDPEGSPNTDGRDGTIHRGEMPNDIGNNGEIGLSSGVRYPVYDVEVIRNPAGTLRNAYPMSPDWTAPEVP